MKTTKKQLKELRKANLDLFRELEIRPPVMLDKNFETIETAPDLPSLDELYQMFDRINSRLFGNQLPRLKIKYSDRMLTAGSFTPNINEIKIGRRYHKIFPDDIEDTLAHEMIHFIYPDHGRMFKRMAGQYGISIKAKEHPALRGKVKYLYYCPSCGREYPRRKRLRLASCGICSAGSIFNPEYKLKLRKK